MTPLMTNVKRPSVRMSKGQVSSVNTGRTSAFNRPKTRATTIK
jgi:hypothetical protein